MSVKSTRPSATNRSTASSWAALGSTATSWSTSATRALVEVLLESDGITGEHGLGLVWPLRRIVADNLVFRTSPDFRNLYMPFDPLLFFADGGNGDQFALLWTLERDDVFVWDHETDSRTWVAPTIEQYLRWWLDGTLRI